MNKSISLVVDGKPVLVNLDPAMPLLYALRSELGLTPSFFAARSTRMRRASAAALRSVTPPR